MNDNTLKKFKFVKRRSNLSKKWSVVVRPGGSTVGCDDLCDEVAGSSGLSRCAVRTVFHWLRRLALNHVADGRPVDLLGLVRVRPQLRLDLPEVATEAEADALLEQRGQAAMAAGVTATVNKEFLRTVQREIDGQTQ